MAVDLKQVLAVRKRVAQAVEERAQVAERLFVGGIWPESKGHLAARDGDVRMQQEIGKEVLQARLGKAECVKYCETP